MKRSAKDAWKGCGKQLAAGQWWHFCGETDMGQTMPVLCEECDPEAGLKLGIVPLEEGHRGPFTPPSVPLPKPTELGGYGIADVPDET